MTEWIEPVEGESLTFRTTGVGLDENVTLRPFYDVHHQRYTVYWNTQPPTGDSSQ